MTFWTFFDRGGAWLLFALCFAVIEGAALLTHHKTLSEQFWAVASMEYGWLLVLGLQAGMLWLFAHLAGR